MSPAIGITLVLLVVFLIFVIAWAVWRSPTDTVVTVVDDDGVYVPGTIVDVTPGIVAGSVMGAAIGAAVTEAIVEETIYRDHAVVHEPVYDPPAYSGGDTYGGSSDSVSSDC